jgi:hypothetical protein
MDTEKQRQIEQRAYALWEAEGQPQGRHEEHWYRAAREVEAQEGETATVSRRRQAPSRGSLNSRSPSPQRRKKAQS